MLICITYLLRVHNFFTNIWPTILRATSGQVSREVLPYLFPPFSQSLLIRIHKHERNDATFLIAEYSRQPLALSKLGLVCDLVVGYLCYQGNITTTCLIDFFIEAQLRTLLSLSTTPINQQNANKQFNRSNNSSIFIFID